MATADRKRAAEARAKALGGRDKRYISALEIERQGYVLRGMTDRVSAVDEQLALYRRGLGLRAPRAAVEPEGD